MFYKSQIIKYLEYEEILYFTYSYTVLAYVCLEEYDLIYKCGTKCLTAMIGGLKYEVNKKRILRIKRDQSFNLKGSELFILLYKLIKAMKDILLYIS